MILFKYIVDKGYHFSTKNNQGTIERLINYIWDSDKTMPYLCGLKAVFLDTIDNIAKQFYFTHIIYNHTKEDMLVHLVVSFSEDMRITEIDVKCVAEAIADIIGQDFQVVYGIHTNQPNLHIHFIINSISYINGYRYKTNTTKLPIFYNAANSIILENTGFHAGGYTYDIY